MRRLLPADRTPMPDRLLPRVAVAEEARAARPAHVVEREDPWGQLLRRQVLSQEAPWKGRSSSSTTAAIPATATTEKDSSPSWADGETCKQKPASSLSSGFAAIGLRRVPPLQCRTFLKK